MSGREAVASRLAKAEAEVRAEWGRLAEAVGVFRHEFTSPEGCVCDHNEIRDATSYLLKVIRYRDPACPVHKEGEPDA